VVPEFLLGLLLGLLLDCVAPLAEVADVTEVTMVIAEVMTKAILKVTESKILDFNWVKLDKCDRCGLDNFTKLVYQSLTIGLNHLHCLGFAHV
jgi:hypothetical protein